MNINWQIVEDALPSLKEVEGGYTLATRGIVTFSDGSRAFVKIGTDDTTRAWVRKEIVAYKFLKDKGYSFIPKLLSYNDDYTAFAIETLTNEQGWNWSNTWNEARLQKTLEAMDALANISLSETEKNLFRQGMVSAGMNGWRRLLESKEKQETLIDKLRRAGYEDTIKNMNITAFAERSDNFVIQSDTLAHNDVRADNCAWNDLSSTVKLVDWSWLQVSDKRIDNNALLVHVYGCGFDVPEVHANRLNTDALLWLAGIWFNGASSSIDQNTSEASELRNYQLVSGMHALELHSLSSIRDSTMTASR